MENKKRAPIILCIMDGWGINKDINHNAVAQAKTPNVDNLSKTYPFSTLEASGEHVGLPVDQVGNSEVGHMNLGSGRVVIQTLPRINQAFENNEIKLNKNFNEFTKIHNQNNTVHLLGLCSDGGVHSHMNHIISISKLLDKKNIKTVIHIFSDGRDSSPLQIGDIIKQFEKSLPKSIKIVSLIGRYFSMDRDNRWDRIKKSFDLITYGTHERKSGNISSAIKLAYETGETDEFISDTVENDFLKVAANKFMDEPDDKVLDPNFNMDDELITPFFSNSLGMTEYSEKLSSYMKSIFSSNKIQDTLGEIISKNNLKKLRLAETEKYPHVTFFFNGGKETVLPGETRLMIPSPKVSTYDQKPEMSAHQVEAELIKAIELEIYDLIIINFANPDMVGHTGNLNAAIIAVETIDKAIGNVKKALDKTNGIMLITADHGNCEVMMHEKTKTPHTAHTCNPVPVILVDKSKNIQIREGGKLADIAPTLLELMGLNQPTEMTGRSLIS